MHRAGNVPQEWLTRIVHANDLDHGADFAISFCELAHALRRTDPLIIASLSRIWMERGDKAKAEHFGAMARMQGWKDELSSPPPPDAGGLR